MDATILSVGDELVLGQTLDTNSAWLSAELAAVGVGVKAHVTVGDDRDAVCAAILQMAGAAEVLLISGGLGPTEDDLTRAALAQAMGVELELDPVALAQITAFFARMSRPMGEGNRVQALRPRGAQSIENTCGTAPGIAAVVGKAKVFVMPGVPHEMRTMFLRDVRGKLGASAGAIVSRTLHTFGLGEMMVAQRLGDLMRRGRNPSVGTTVSHGIVSVRINARADARAQALDDLAQTEAACRRALGNIVFGQDEQTLATAVGEGLARAGKTVATAESCTGGMLAKMLTDVSGSSKYFQRGWVTYSDVAKREMLGVPAELLATQGAVSEGVAAALARGARERAGADWAVAITGVAGPTGGTPTKPVGMVCLAWAHAAGVTARTVQFSGDREFVRMRSAVTALGGLLLGVKGMDWPT